MPSNLINKQTTSDLQSPVCPFVATIVTTVTGSQYIHLLQVVQEYERAVIFRLGRLVSGGARGPGVFFIIPCVDVYEKIDMRTTTYEIPPQEVNKLITKGLQFRTKIVD